MRSEPGRTQLHRGRGVTDLHWRQTHVYRGNLITDLDQCSCWERKSTIWKINWTHKTWKNEAVKMLWNFFVLKVPVIVFVTSCSGFSLFNWKSQTYNLIPEISENPLNSCERVFRRWTDRTGIIQNKSCVSRFYNFMWTFVLLYNWYKTTPHLDEVPLRCSVAAHRPTAVTPPSRVCLPELDQLSLWKQHAAHVRADFNFTFQRGVGGVSMFPAALTWTECISTSPHVVVFWIWLQILEGD